VDNKLSLHLGKTEVILFGSRRKLKKVVSFSVTCGDITINQVTTVKYLGVILDDALTFSDFVNSLLKKVSSKFSFLYRQSAVLTEQSRRILCSALINLIWIIVVQHGLRV
jgi:hypothetical protein